MSLVMCYILHVMCHVSRVPCFLFWIFGNVVEPISGGSVINEDDPVFFYSFSMKFLYIGKSLHSTLVQDPGGAAQA